jgi:hypothetical protein
MSVGLFFPKLPSYTKTHQLTFNIYSLLIAVIYNQLDVNIYQQHISSTHIINKSSPQGTQRTQDVCTIFFLLRTTILGVFQQQLNRVQLYKSTSSIMKTHLTHSTPTEKRIQSSTNINLQHVHDLSVVQPTCVRSLAHYNPCMYAANV